MIAYIVVYGCNRCEDWGIVGVYADRKAADDKAATTPACTHCDRDHCCVEEHAVKP